MDGKVVLLTGGTGSFGQAFTIRALNDRNVRMLRIFSRDEHKQRAMQTWASRLGPDRVSFYIGDVRDKDRLRRAMDGVDWVVHAAALKQAPLGETEPQEFIKTNIQGSINVTEAAADAGAEKALLISTDKAVEPINLYGATKMCAERIFAQADRQRGTTRTRFAFTRYGNVAGTNGSVIPLFEALPKGKPTPITHLDATRFWITLGEAVTYVMKALNEMRGGEAFIPRLKSVRIVDLHYAIRPFEAIDVVGLRPGDKLHEKLDATYSSDANELLTVDELRALLRPEGAPHDSCR